MVPTLSHTYRNKKSLASYGKGFLFLSKGVYSFLQSDCARGACISTGTTLCALVGVDRVLLTLRDCTYGTLIDTCAASNTIIINYVSHNCSFLN